MFDEIPLGIWVLVVMVVIALVTSWSDPLQGALLAMPLMAAAAVGGAVGGYQLGGEGVPGVAGLIVGGLAGYYGVGYATLYGTAQWLAARAP